MNPSTRLAVLIDAENTSHRLADRVFDLIKPLGVVTERRLYGDFAGPAGSWAEAAARHAMDARHCFAPTAGKNGADIALTIGAIDLLRDGATDGFCIVSSDGDFAALAKRIRAGGRLAYGIGRATAAQFYRDACTTYLCLDAPAATASHPALPAILMALNACPNEAGWYHLAQFGSAARRAGIVPKAFGAQGIGALLRATGQFRFDDRQRFRQAPVLRAVSAGQ